MTSTTAAPDDRESSDLGELVRAMWARRLWIICGGLSSALIAGIVAFTMTPIFRSSTVLTPASSNQSSLAGSLGSALGSLGSLAGFAGLNLDSTNGATDEALAVLQSRQFSAAFIADKDLMPVFFPEKWDSQNRRWKVPPDQQPTPARAFKYFDREVRSVTQDKKTGLVTLQIDWKDPEVAAAWANELVQRLNAEMQGRALAEANASLGFLEKELAGTNTVETRSAINRLVETQINRRMLANVTEQFAFRVVDRALPPDRGDKIRPKKALMIVAGGCLGGFLACVMVLLTRGRGAAKRAN